MRKSIFYLTLCILSISFSVNAQTDYTKLVNPFIGTGAHGHTYPGATMPFGMMQLSPDTRMADWDGSSGYHYSDSVIYGFSHTHLSGTGVPDYCDILFMPFTGAPHWKNTEYRSPFSHKNEKASPGYYEVLLDKNNIKVQLTTSLRSGMHQYTFPSSADTGSVLIDLEHRDQLLDGSIEQVNAYEIKGVRRSKSWAQDQIIYFYVQFDKPIAKLLSDRPSLRASRYGDDVAPTTIPFHKVALSFLLKKDKTVRAKIGISGVSIEGAKKNLEAEIKDWNFDQLRTAARKAWNKELGKIEIKGGTKDQQTVFYTALYHTLVVPNIYQDVDGIYCKTDSGVLRAKDFTNYTVFSLWDTYRAYHPLMTIIDQKRTNDWINTFLHFFERHGRLPVWELSNNETNCMIGNHAIPVIADAWQKGIRNYDPKLAMNAMRASYFPYDRGGNTMYRKKGFFGKEDANESVSQTLEFSYDDWCVSQFATWTNSPFAKDYTLQSQNYKNLYDPSTGFFRGKVQSIWYKPFEPREINGMYTEANAWQYNFAVQHDIETLIKLHGGQKRFATQLDELFTTTSQTTGREQSDVTGLIGQYAHGNEPSHHLAYLFNYVGMPWRTQELVHKVSTEFYTNTPEGLIGNEDCGQMSAWYVLSAMGFYPVCPGNGQYVIGTPLFDEVKIHLENGKTFTISSKHTSPSAFYITSAALNGKPYTKTYLQHTDIMKGGAIQFNLSKTKNENWGSQPSGYPTSKVVGEELIPVPYFYVPFDRFHDSVLITIGDIDPSASIHYQLVRSKEDGSYEDPRENALYTHPFHINFSCVIYVYAEKNGKQSVTVDQGFNKLRSDRSITYLSKVNPLYPGSGPDALIDGIGGWDDWHTGDWVGFFNTDFEAVVDLKRTQPIQHLGLQVLQDIPAWILFPKEVVFYGSDDGTNYKEVARVKNTNDPKSNAPRTLVLNTEVKTEARYIKVVAVNGGKLPEWHESAGNPSHLFIGEVEIR